MINLRQKLLARLHCVKKELSLDDDAYRKSHRLAGLIGESAWTAGFGGW